MMRRQAKATYKSGSTMGGLSTRIAAVLVGSILGCAGRISSVGGCLIINCLCVSLALHVKPWLKVDDGNYRKI